MINHAFSALICAERLLRLAGLHPMGTEEFTGKNNIQPDAVVPDKQLKIHIDKFAAPLSARFRLQKLPLKKLTPEHLPALPQIMLVNQ